jgi:cysteine synthase A
VTRDRPLTLVEGMELPRTVVLGSDRLCAAAFPLMKLRPARFMLDQARAEGRIGPGSLIIETSSGTFGLGLALVCREQGYRLMLVADPAIDHRLRRRLEDLGAHVEIVTEPAAVGGYQGARLQRMAELQAAHPDHYWPSQYHNPANPASYAPVAELLVETLGRIDFLVGAVGSGGSMCGTAGYLRRVMPGLRAVGVDTLGSVLFGQPDSGLRLLRGLGNSLMPQNLDHTVFDEVHWVAAAEGFRATRELHRGHALYMGPTSGAAYLAARWIARSHPDAAVVVLMADEAYRYEDSVYDDAWLAAKGARLDVLPSSPRTVAHPRDAGPGWSRFDWGRRTYQQVMGGVFAAGEGTHVA